MTEATSRLEKATKLSLGIICYLAFLWFIIRTGEFFFSLVILLGISVLVAYILLGPVQLMQTAICRGLLYCGQARQLQWLKTLACHHFPRVISILLVYCLFIASLVFFSVRFMPIIFSQLQQFARDLPQYSQRWEEWILGQKFAQDYFHQEITALQTDGKLSSQQLRHLQREQQQQITHQLQVTLSETEKEVIRERIFRISPYVDTFVKTRMNETFSNLIQFLGSAMEVMILALTGLLIVFYFLLDGHHLKQGFLSTLPKASRSWINQIMTSFHAVMFGFIKGQVILGIATGVYMIIIYSIFGVPYAFFLGAFFAVSEIIPVVGTWLGFLPGIIVLLFISPVKLVFIAGLVYLYQAIKDNVVAPRIMGRVLGLHPIIVIVSLMVCAKVAGLIGIIFAIPLASLANVLIRFFQKQDATADLATEL